MATEGGKRLRSASPGIATRSSRSSSRSSRLSSIASNSSSGSNKRAREKTDGKENEVVMRVTNAFAEEVATLRASHQERDIHREEERRRIRYNDPMRLEARKYANYLLKGDPQCSQEGEKFQQMSHARAKEKIDRVFDSENNTSHMREEWLDLRGRLSDIRDQAVEKSTIYSVPLEMDEDDLDDEKINNLRTNAPVIIMTYDEDYRGIVARTEDCPRFSSNRGSCICVENIGSHSLVKFQPGHLAARRGDIKFFIEMQEASKTNHHLKSLFEKWCDSTVLVEAIENDQFRLVEYLLSTMPREKLRKWMMESGEDIHEDYPHSYKLNIPAIVTERKNLTLLRNLFSKGLVSNSCLDRILLEAVNTDDVDFFRSVAEIVANVGDISRLLRVNRKQTTEVMRDQKTHFRDTVFHRAVYRGNLHILRECLFLDSEQQRANALSECLSLSIQDNNGLTPLYSAIATGQNEMINLLFEKEGPRSDHDLFLFDLGLETNQEKLSLGFVECIQEFNPDTLAETLNRAVVCKKYKVVHGMLKKACNEEKLRDHMPGILHCVLLTVPQLFTESSDVRAGLFAMLVLAGGRVPITDDFSKHVTHPSLYEGLRRLKRLERDGFRLPSIVVEHEYAVEELIRHTNEQLSINNCDADVTEDEENGF